MDIRNIEVDPAINVAVKDDLLGTIRIVCTVSEFNSVFEKIGNIAERHHGTVKTCSDGFSFNTEEEAYQFSNELEDDQEITVDYNDVFPDTSN